MAIKLVVPMSESHWTNLNNEFMNLENELFYFHFVWLLVEQRVQFRSGDQKLMELNEFHFVKDILRFYLPLVNVGDLKIQS